MKRTIKTLCIVLLCLALLGVGAVFGVNGYVKRVGGAAILTAEKTAELDGIDCIIILGCQVRATERPAICCATD